MSIEILKDNTFKIRMDAVTLDMMERAREFLHLDKSKFIRQSIRKMAEEIIREHDQTRFSAEDWQKFFAILDNPPEPTNRMKKAAKKYKEIIQENEV